MSCGVRVVVAKMRRLRSFHNPQRIARKVESQCRTVPLSLAGLLANQKDDISSSWLLRARGKKVFQRSLAVGHVRKRCNTDSGWSVWHITHVFEMSIPLDCKISSVGSPSLSSSHKKIRAFSGALIFHRKWCIRDISPGWMMNLYAERDEYFPELFHLQSIELSSWCCTEVRKIGRRERMSLRKKEGMLAKGNWSSVCWISGRL